MSKLGGLAIKDKYVELGYALCIHGVQSGGKRRDSVVPKSYGGRHYACIKHNADRKL